jgi:hypothetical protein
MSTSDVVKTTELAIVNLLAGTLLVLSLGVLAYSIFPLPVEATLYSITINAILKNEFILVLGFISVAYGLGIVGEFLGMSTFEWKHRRIKAQHLVSFVDENAANIHKSAILKPLYDATTQKAVVTAKQADKLIGEMRFRVLMMNPSLTREIESQIERLRLLRVLFWAEIFLSLAVVVRTLRAYEPILILGALFMIGLVCLTVWEVIKRFHRYCRSVERSYKLLILEE